MTEREGKEEGLEGSGEPEERTGELND